MPITINGDSGLSGVNGSAGTPALQGTDSNTGIVFGTDEVQISTGGTTRAIVDSSGNVALTSTSASATQQILFSDATSGRGKIVYRHNGDSLAFETFSSERMRIDGSGKIQVTGTRSGSLQPSDDDSLELYTSATSGSANTGSGLTFYNHDSSGFEMGGTIQTAKENGTADNTSSYMRFSTRANGSSATERLRLRSDGRMLVPGVYAETTGGSANVNVQSDGLMQRSVSSIKYKKDVETLQDSYADALLNVRPVWYKSKCTSDNPDWGHWGFIAEELAEIDPRLVIWKTAELSYDEQSVPVKTACEPEAEGVQYDRFVPHLLNLIKRQQTAIETLETQNASFEARLTALEGGAS